MPALVNWSYSWNNLHSGLCVLPVLLLRLCLCHKWFGRISWNLCKKENKGIMLRLSSQHSGDIWDVSLIPFTSLSLPRLFSHVDDPFLDDPLPREFVLYLRPSGPLQNQLSHFWQQSRVTCGKNKAHNIFPHITLCQFFMVSWRVELTFNWCCMVLWRLKVMKGSCPRQSRWPLVA